MLRNQLYFGFIPAILVLGGTFLYSLFIQSRQNDNLEKIQTYAKSLIINTETYQKILNEPIASNSANGFETEALKASMSSLRTGITDTKASLAENRRWQRYITLGGLFTSIFLLILAAYYSAKKLTDPIKPHAESAEEIPTSALPPLSLQPEPDTTIEMANLQRAFQALQSDITEYKEQANRLIEINHRRMKEFCNQLPHPIFFLDEKLAVDYKNPAADRLTKHMGAPNFFPEEVCDGIKTLVESKENTAYYKFEESISFRVESGREFFLPLLVKVNPDEAESAEYILFLQDISAIKLSEELDTDMIATISHEIRTPITSAILAVHLLMEDYLGPQNDAQMEMLKIARNDLDRLKRILNSFLEISKIGKTREPEELMPREKPIKHF